MQGIDRSLRGQFKSALWARGERLFEARAVKFGEIKEDEVEATVIDRRNIYEVVIYPGTAPEWDCNCGSPFDPCEHVAAVVFAAEHGVPESKGEAAAGGTTSGHVGYRLEDHRGALALRRVIVGGGREHPVGSNGLSGALPGVRGVPDYALDAADRTFDRRMGAFSGGEIPDGLVVGVLKLLRDVADLSFRGIKLRVGPPSSGLKLRIMDHKDVVVARLVQDEDVREVFRNRVLRRADTIHPVIMPDLTHGRMQELRRGKISGLHQLTELVSEVIPECKKAGIAISIETDRLPSSGGQRVLPHLWIHVDDAEGGCTLRAQIEYGEPPVARVVQGKMRLLSPGGDVPPRLPAQERRLLETYTRVLGADPEGEVCSRTRAILLLARAEEVGRVRIDDQTLRNYRVDAELVPSLRTTEEGGVVLSFLSDTGARVEASVDEVVSAWASGEQFAPLSSGGFGTIPEGWMEQHGHLVSDLLEARALGGELPRSRAVAPELVRLCEAMDQPGPPRLSRLVAMAAGELEPTPFVAPQDLDAELRDYQVAGARWLDVCRQMEVGALLADDMGLGKTLQTLCVVEGKTLVVAPTSVLRNWEEEAYRFRPGLAVSVYHGSGRRLPEGPGLVLTSYALLRNDLDDLSEVDWDTVVLDEAQTIKNPTSKVAQAAFKLPARFRVALTGTPIENRLEELWSQFHFLNPGFLGGRKTFRERYERPISAGDPETAARLRRRIGPFILRRLKREVASELPPRTDVVLRCSLREEERRRYDAIRAATLEEVVAMLGQGKGVFKALEALLRLRQAACHGALLPSTSGENIESSSKVDLLMETLEQVLGGGHRALIFSQWTSMLDLIEAPLDARGVRWCRLDGSTRDRAAVVQEFQADDGPPVMLISLKAGGTGLNLTAADHVFLMDPWWNPAVEDQAADRAHRIGQDRPVLVHRMIASDTVEERILALQARKRSVAEAAVGTGGGGGGISRDELLALLQET